MAKFKKRQKDQPAINTSALPDIVFMLIFFFMVATVIRENTLLVKNIRPQATEVTKVQQKSLTEYIFIGEPKQTDVYGTAPRIQLNDALATKDDVIPFVEAKRDLQAPELRPMMVWSLKVDKDTKMGIVTDVKQELRKAEALKILYSSIEKIEE